MKDNNSKGKVLLTGGSGFIASHCLDALLEDGFEVTVTVRSEEKGKSCVEGVKKGFEKYVTYAIVEDVAKDGCFDDALRSEPFDYVIHTASPYHMNVQDPVKDFLDPAIKGTTGILKSIRDNAPSVRRVVITSSSAAMLNPGNHAKVYDESIWTDVTWEEAMNPINTYRASKKFAEKAAWDFVEKEKVRFDLATINCTFSFGPIQRKLSSLDAMNASNHRIRDMMLGRMRDGLEPTAPVFTWVDVRDVATSHVRAMAVPAAGGNRFYIVGGYFSNKRIADIVRRSCPRLAERLPEDPKDDFEDVFEFDNRKSRELLGMRYIDLETCIADTVQSILEHPDFE